MKSRDCGHPFRVLVLICLVEPIWWTVLHLHDWLWWRVMDARHWAFEGDCPF